MTAPSRPTRFAFLDSVRALAAWYVVFHHIWLAAFVRFPENVGPWVIGWLKWGYLAVAVFIVVSGFSLALRPARDHDELRDGVGTFLRRRAFRILPPYWVALLISAAVMLLYTGSRAGVATDAKAIGVHALLLQDVIGSKTPNGAFWSIAIEWQIYFVFPLLLWLARRFGPWKMLGLTTAAVVVVQILGQNVPALDRVLNLTPQFLALFAMGLVAGRATVLAREHEVTRRIDRARLAAGLSSVGVLGVLAILAFVPPDRVVDQFFLVSLGCGALMAWLLFAMGDGRLPRVRRLLERRPLPFLGSFSYSTYLLHIPVLALVQYAVVNQLATDAITRFVLLVVFGVPAVFVVTYGFHRLFERPFIDHRSLGSLVGAARRRPAVEAQPASTPSTASSTPAAAPSQVNRARTAPASAAQRS